jgi:hypothetical protein
MNFKVHLTTKQSGSLIDNVNFGTGLDIFKMAQKENPDLDDVKNLQIGSCQLNRNEQRTDIYIKGQEQINSIPCFEANDVAEVIVPPGILGLYVKLVFKRVNEKSYDIDDFIPYFKFLWRKWTNNPKLSEVHVSRKIDW